MDVAWKLCMTFGIFTSGSHKLGYSNDIKFIPFISVVKLANWGDAVLKALTFASCVWVLRFWIKDLLLVFGVSFFNRILHSCCCTILSRNTEVHGKRPGSLGPWGTCDKHFFRFITMLRNTAFASSLGPIVLNSNYDIFIRTNLTVLFLKCFLLKNWNQH